MDNYNDETVTILVNAHVYKGVEEQYARDNPAQLLGTATQCDMGISRNTETNPHHTMYTSE